METDHVDEVACTFMHQFLSDDEWALTVMCFGVENELPVIVIGEGLKIEFERPSLILAALMHCMELEEKGGLVFSGSMGHVLASLQSTSDNYEDNIDRLRSGCGYVVGPNREPIMRILDVESYIEILEELFG